MKIKISASKEANMLNISKQRLKKNIHRQMFLIWSDVYSGLVHQSYKLQSITQLVKNVEGQDIITFDIQKDVFVFYTCSTESQYKRRSLYLDQDALDNRKELRIRNCAVRLAYEIIIKILDEKQYVDLQVLEKSVAKMIGRSKSSENVRNPGVSIFGDYLLGRVFFLS